ncbi:MAG: hypothetical protein LCH26_06575 [Proteobacteria bacterium]|nr:hypothetical protein [Pseudomonadota bacterium]
MSIGKTKAFAAMSARLKWDQENIKVATDNLARAQLPGEKQKRLSPFSFQHILGKSGLSRTSATHMTGTQDHGRTVQVTTSSQDEESISKNNISPQEEMMHINDSSTRAHQMTTLHKKLIGMYKNILTVAK